MPICFDPQVGVAGDNIPVGKQYGWFILFVKKCLTLRGSI